MKGRILNLLAIALIFSLMLNFVPLSSALEDNSTPVPDNDTTFSYTWVPPPENSAPDNLIPENFYLTPDNSFCENENSPEDPAQLPNSPNPHENSDPPAWPPLRPFTGEGWSYRRPITITNPGGALENYQVRIENLDLAQLTAAGKMQTNYADLRFSWQDPDTGQAYELPYWIEPARVGEVYVPPTDYVARWRFDEVSGDIAHDETGEHDGTVTNGTWAGGRFNNSLELTNGYVLVPDHPDFQITEALTLEAWVYVAGYPANPPAYYGLISRGPSPSEFQLLLEYTGRLHFRRSAAVGHYLWTLPLNSWNHLVITSDPAATNFYLNGGLKATFAGLTGAPTNNALCIGCYDPAGGYPFTGKIDEVRIYARALTWEEILALYVGNVPVTENAPPKVWVRVPSLPAGENTLIHAYYGNPGAPPAENGDATFEFFDGFEGASVDNTKWDTHDGWPMGEWPAVSESMMVCDNSPQLKGVYSRSVFSPPTVLRFRARIAALNFAMGGFWGMYDHGYYVAAYYITAHIAYTTFGSDEFSRPAGPRYTYELRREPARQRWYLDDVLDVTQSYSILTPAYIIFYSHSGGEMEVDWVLIRGYAEPEPTASVGEEEMAGPSSRVDPINPYWRNQVPFQITASSSGTVDNIELWSKYSTDNSSWGDWALFRVDNDNADGWSWSFTAPEGDGYYEFYSIAVGSREEPPGVADARVGVDSVAPESRYWYCNLIQIYPPKFEISGWERDELSGVELVSRWYRFSHDGVNWSEWKEILQQGLFSPDESIGLYEFYSTAIDRAGNVEEAPAEPDSWWSAEVYRVAYIPVKYAPQLWLGLIDISPQPERTVSELKTRAELVRLYYWQQSFGKAVLLNEFIFDEWRSLGKTQSEFPEGEEWWMKWRDIWNDAVALSGINRWEYDAVVVVQPVEMRSLSYVITHDKAPLSIWAHELGHALFNWRDYYPDPDRETAGDIHYWGIMGHSLVPEWWWTVPINPPPPVMSYNKVRAGWLNFRDVPIHASWEDLRWYQGEVDLIETQRYGERVLKYDTRYGLAENYIFEGRYPKDGVTLSDPWQGEKYPLWSEEGVLLYKIERGTGRIYTIPAREYITYWFVPGIPIQLAYDEHNRVTLKPGESYLDEEADVEFFVIRAGRLSKPSFLQLNVYEYSSITNRTVFSLSNIQFTGLLPSSIEPPELGSRFDIDLHVYTPDNKHVGPRYDNREYMFYDLEIENANTSRNILGGGPEWIAIPDNIEAYAVIDATLAKEWVEELGITPENAKITASARVVSYDENGIRQESRPVTLNISLIEPTPLAVPAVVDIDPNTLNLKSMGRWTTAYIELPEGYTFENVDISTVALVAVDNVRLAQPVRAVSEPTEIGDHDGDGAPELMVKFDRSAVQVLLQPGEVRLSVGGNFVDRLPFEGSDVIQVR